LHAVTRGNVLSEVGKLLRRKRQQRLSGEQMKAVTVFATPHLGAGAAAIVLSSISYCCQFEPPCVVRVRGANCLSRLRALKQLLLGPERFELFAAIVLPASRSAA
jgi:hypothetical protein